MTESLAGSIRFLVRSGTSPLPGAGIWTSINRMTWYYRGYTDSVGSLIVMDAPLGLNYYIVSKTGYNIATGSTNVPLSGGIQLNVYLTKSLSVMSADTMGSLKIASDPEGAQVYINGGILETITPVTITNIPEGDYVLELAKDGCRSATMVRIDRGQTAILTASLYTK